MEVTLLWVHIPVLHMFHGNWNPKEPQEIATAYNPDERKNQLSRKDGNHEEMRAKKSIRPIGKPRKWQQAVLPCQDFLQGEHMEHSKETGAAAAREDRIPLAGY